MDRVATKEENLFIGESFIGEYFVNDFMKNTRQSFSWIPRTEKFKKSRYIRFYITAFEFFRRLEVMQLASCLTECLLPFPFFNSIKKLESVPCMEL